MRCRVALLELGQLARAIAASKRGTSSLELARTVASIHASSSADSSRGDACAPIADVRVQLRPQAGLLAPRVLLERLVDELLDRPLDSSLEQVSGLRARIRQLGDPPLEHLGPCAQLIEGQLDRARLKARRLRDLARRASGQLRDRAQQQRLTLLGGQLTQARQEWSEPFAADGR